MERVTLGRTGLEVGVLGLGCGGPSRLGASHGATRETSMRLVQRAVDLGVTLIDTARLYGTEEIVGDALVGHREAVVLSTKALAANAAGPVSAASLRASLEKSLRRLRTDVVDLFHLHSVMPGDYDHCLSELAPTMLDLRAAGKVRYLAISERYSADPKHEMLERALGDGVWDVVMVGLSILDRAALDRVLPLAAAQDVGVIVMSAVPAALRSPEALAEAAAQQRGATDLLPRLLGPDPAPGATVRLAYRFALDQRGAHVVLTGTGSIAHLEANIVALEETASLDRDRRAARELAALFAPG